MTIMASMQAARGGMWEASARFATSAAKVAEAGLARRSVAEVDGQAPVADAVPPLGEAHRLVHPLLLLVHTVRNALSLSLSYDRDRACICTVRGIERIASERSEEYASHIVQIYPRTP